MNINYCTSDRKYKGINTRVLYGFFFHQDTVFYFFFNRIFHDHYTSVLVNAVATKSNYLRADNTVDDGQYNDNSNDDDNNNYCRANIAVSSYLRCFPEIFKTPNNIILTMNATALRINVD